MRKLLYLLYWVLSLTWGLIMTLVGGLVALALLITGHKPKHLGPNVYFVVGKYWGGVNFGPFFLTSSLGEKETKYHESGHGLQNIIWGPLFVFVIAIPSAIRYWYRDLKYGRKGLQPPTEYDDIWFEGQATSWGDKVYNK